MKFSRLIALLSVLTLLSGCASIHRLPAPADYETLGMVSGIPEARFWGDRPHQSDDADIDYFAAQTRTDPDFHPADAVHLLALSGGGQNGAFGAGLLAGWTASGKRPEFRMVTGISTGSLIAPFAFLGSDYDPVIKAMYTQFSTKDVLSVRFFSGLFNGDSVADNDKLRKIMGTYLTPAVIEQIGQEYHQGRRLFVGTTYLDVQRPVVWDITAIAAGKRPRARELIIDILLASAAIPGAFPPAYFEAEHNGQKYDELHVDGGVTMQVFISSITTEFDAIMERMDFSGDTHVYLIRNAKVAPRVEHVKPKTLPILVQSLSTLLYAQSMGDIERIYQKARLHNMELHIAHIPAGFRDEPKEPFDITYMSELFNLSFDQAASGDPWSIEMPHN
jgi:predicted acylesterase/phospholipase RssA